MQHLKTLTSQSRKGQSIFLKGAFFSPFNKRGELLPRHELDANPEGYYNVLDEIVIPTIQNIAPTHKDFQRRVKEVVHYTAASFTDTWSFATELTYRLVAPPEHQTTENIKKVRILRATMDLTLGMVALLDDISDNTTERRMEKAWHLRCPGGTRTAIYDGALLGYYATHLIKTHFRNAPGYTILMETVMEANMKCKIGQILDLLEQGKDSTIEKFLGFASYKAGDIVAAMVVLGGVHAGVLDEGVLNQMKDIFWKFGVHAQIWDDFQDYYNDFEKTGSPPCDIHNAGTTWVNTTALKYFDDSQKRIYKECYGSKDPEKVEAVMRLFDEVDIPRLYIESMRKLYIDVREHIERLPEQRLKDACNSYMDWLMRDVCDPYYEQTKRRLKL